MFKAEWENVPITRDNTNGKNRAGRVFARHSGDGTNCNAACSRVRSGAGYHPRTEVKRSGGVAILGAGHGGLALAGYLAQHGHKVALWNRSPARIAPLAALGGIHLTLPGSAAAFTPLALASSSIAAVLANARLVLVAVPAFAHAEIARVCAPHLRDGQTMLLLPGRTGGALEFGRVLREAHCRAEILLGEANTFPLAARCVGATTAVVYGAKSEVRASALPALRTPELVTAFQPVLPMLLPGHSVLHTGLANLGAILHPTITLLNAERIKRGDSFDFYTEGVTARVAAALDAADAERLSIARAYGVAACSLPAWIAAAYGHHANTMQEAVAGNPAYVGIKAPTTVAHRYLLEDVPTGLIPLIELGKAAGLALPALRGLVGEALVALGGEVWRRPRTLSALGLEGLSTEGIRTFAERGVVTSAKAVKPGGSIFRRCFGAGPEWVPQLGSGV